MSCRVCFPGLGAHGTYRDTVTGVLCPNGIFVEGKSAAFEPAEHIIRDPVVNLHAARTVFVQRSVLFVKDAAGKQQRQQAEKKNEAMHIAPYSIVSIRICTVRQ